MRIIASNNKGIYFAYHRETVPKLKC